MGIELVVLAKTGAAEVVIEATEEEEELAPRVVRGIKATGLEVLLLADMAIMVVLEELVLGKRVGRMAGAEEEVIIGMAEVLVLLMLGVELELELELTVDSGMTDMMEAELEVVLFIIMLELEELEELELELELGPTVVMGMIGMAWRELLLVLVLAEVLLLETMGTRVAVGAAEEEEDDQLDQVEPVHEEELLLGETT